MKYYFFDYFQFILYIFLHIHTTGIVMRVKEKALGFRSNKNYKQICVLLLVHHFAKVLYLSLYS